MNINKKKEILDISFRLFIVISTNILYAISTVWFLEPCGLYSGGATGLAQLVNRIFALFNIDINLGLLVFLINVPIILIGIKYVSKKFAIYSIIAVLVQSVFTAFLSKGPFTDFSTFITWEQKEVLNYGGILTLALFGGVLSGAASGLALKYGTSTGGIDIVAQALSLKKNVSIGNFVMAFNVLLAVVGGLCLESSFDLGMTIFLFTCIRMIINSLVMDKIHTSYSFQALYIFTKHKDLIAQDIINEVKRGCTFIPVKGAYSQADFYEIYTVVSKYEVEKVLKIIKRHDENAFITVQPVKSIKGNFKNRSII